MKISTSEISCTFTRGRLIPWFISSCGPADRSVLSCAVLPAGFPTSSTRSSSSTWRCRWTSTTAVSGMSETRPSSRGSSWLVVHTAWGKLLFVCLTSLFQLLQGILNPMQAFLNTLAFHGWTGFDVDLSPRRSRELAWESVSTSVPNTSHNPLVGATLHYQSHVQEAKKTSLGNGHHHSDTVSILSEGNWAFSSSNSNHSPVYQGWWRSKAHQPRLDRCFLGISLWLIQLGQIIDRRNQCYRYDAGLHMTKWRLSFVSRLSLTLLSARRRWRANERVQTLISFQGRSWIGVYREGDGLIWAVFFAVKGAVVRAVCWYFVICCEIVCPSRVYADCTGTSSVSYL